MARAPAQARDEYASRLHRVEAAMKSRMDLVLLRSLLHDPELLAKRVGTNDLKEIAQSLRAEVGGLPVQGKWYGSKSTLAQFVHSAYRALKQAADGTGPGARKRPLGNAAGTVAAHPGAMTAADVQRMKKKKKQASPAPAPPLASAAAQQQRLQRLQQEHRQEQQRHELLEQIERQLQRQYEHLQPGAAGGVAAGGAGYGYGAAAGGAGAAAGAYSHPQPYYPQGAWNSAYGAGGTTADPPLENVLLQHKDEPRSNDEAKSEPETWGDLQPVTADEMAKVQRLSSLGFSRHKVLKTLRLCSDRPDQLQWAQQRLCEELRDLQEAKLMDDVALTSEDTGRADRSRAEKEKQRLMAYTDIVGEGEFRNSMFLDGNVGLPWLKEVVEVERGGVFDLSESDLRDECIKLLVLEGKSFTWYGFGVCPYMYSVTLRLQSQPRSMLALRREVEKLESILFHMPTRPGDMPKEFLDAAKTHPLADLRRRCSTALAARATGNELAQHDDMEVLEGPVAAPVARASDGAVDLTL